MTAIDRSHEMITKARQRLGNVRNVTLVEDDLLGGALPENRFDFIVAVAVVHHMAFDRAADQMAQLLRPGGTLAILGLARNGAPFAWGPSPRDYLWIPPGLLYSWFQRIRLGWWDPGAPTVEPTPAPQFQPARIVNTNGLGVNVRKQPGPSALNAGVLREGTRVLLTGNDQTVAARPWREIETEDHNLKGWVQGDFLQLLQTAP